MRKDFSSKPEGRRRLEETIRRCEEHWNQWQILIRKSVHAEGQKMLPYYHSSSKKLQINHPAFLKVLILTTNNNNNNRT